MLGHLIPVLTGCAIGYFTNWLAIKMLFWPKRPVIIMGRQVPLTPGLMVKRKRDFARAVGAVVERKFTDEDYLVKVSLRANDNGDLARLAMKNNYASLALGFYCKMFNRRDLAEHVRAACSLIKSERVVRHFVEGRVDDMPIEEVEDMVMQVAERETKGIARVGGVIGFLIGVMNVVVGKAVELLLG